MTKNEKIKMMPEYSTALTNRKSLLRVKNEAGTVAASIGSVRI